jgi:septal ring factor EnvC (AmiA/AmiB activator)
MSDPAQFEERLAALEQRIEEVAADATAARHLAAASDRDLADLTTKVDAHRQAINGLGVQTAARFDRLEQHVDAGFAEMRGRFDQTAAGMGQIVELLTRRDAR